jgi:hypothetical protein
MFRQEYTCHEATSLDAKVQMATLHFANGHTALRLRLCVQTSLDAKAKAKCGHEAPLYDINSLKSKVEI